MSHELYDDSNGWLKHGWEKILAADDRIRKSPFLRFHSRNEKIVAGGVATAIVAALLIASNVFHFGETPFVGNQPPHPVASVNNQPFPTVHNPPTYAQLDRHCGKPINTNGPSSMGIVPDSPNATVAVNAWNHCSNEGGLPIREQAAHELGMTPEQFDRAASAILGSLGTGRHYAGGAALPLDDRPKPDMMVPVRSLTGPAVDPTQLGQRNDQKQIAPATNPN